MFDLLINGLQTLPGLQCFCIFIIQLTLYVSLIYGQLKHKFLDGWIIVMHNMIMETCTLVFVIMALLLSFDTEGILYSNKTLTIIEAISIGMLIVNAFIETFLLFFYILWALVEQIV